MTTKTELAQRLINLAKFNLQRPVRMMTTATTTKNKMLILLRRVATDTSSHLKFVTALLRMLQVTFKTGGFRRMRTTRSF